MIDVFEKLPKPPKSVRQKRREARKWIEAWGFWLKEIREAKVKIFNVTYLDPVYVYFHPDHPEFGELTDRLNLKTLPYLFFKRAKAFYLKENR